MKEKRKNRKKGLLIGIIAGAAALIGLGVGAFFLFKGNEPASPTGTPTEDTEFSSETEPETEPETDDGDLVDHNEFVAV